MSVHDRVSNVVQVRARMPSLPDDKQELEERQEYTCLVIHTLFAGNPISITRSSPVSHRHPHDFSLERQRLKTADLRTVTSQGAGEGKHRA